MRNLVSLNIFGPFKGFVILALFCGAVGFGISELVGYSDMLVFGPFFMFLFLTILKFTTSITEKISYESTCRDLSTLALLFSGIALFTKTQTVFEIFAFGFSIVYFAITVYLVVVLKPGAIEKKLITLHNLANYGTTYAPANDDNSRGSAKLLSQKDLNRFSLNTNNPQKSIIWAVNDICVDTKGMNYISRLAVEYYKEKNRLIRIEEQKKGKKVK